MSNGEVKLKNICKAFTTSFWSGKRWVTFPMMSRCFNKEQINFYVSFQKANAYCAKRSVNGRAYGVGAVADILKQINIIKENPNTEYLFSTAPQITIPFPISPFNSQFNLERELCSGEYAPVLWKVSADEKVFNNEVPALFSGKSKISMNQFVAIVRYNEKKDCIEFYDGKLKRCLPGSKLIPVNGCFFDFNGKLINFFRNCKI